MRTFIDTLFDTEWGLAIIGILILGAILFEFFDKKPKI